MLKKFSWYAVGISALLLGLAVSSAHASVVPAAAPPAPCAITVGVVATCYDLDVVCEGIPSRRARIRQLDVAAGTTVVGNVLFTTGNDGKAVYGAPGTPHRVGTILVMHNNGYRTFEVVWLDPEGWQSGAYGFGWSKSLCAYAEVVKYLADPAPAGGDKMPETNLGGVLGKNIRAAGNSGGSAQIAYGLTVHNLEAYLTVAVFSGGPPVSDMYAVCFDTQYNRYTAPTGLAIGPDHPGRVNIDKAVGFYSAYDVAGVNFCKNFARPAGDTGSGVLPPSADAINADSLLSTGLTPEPRDFSAPFTCQRFVQAEFDSSGAHNQGALYYDRVRANQPFTTLTYSVPGSAVHEIDTTPAGAVAVRVRLLAACH